MKSISDARGKFVAARNKLSLREKLVHEIFVGLRKRFDSGISHVFHLFRK